MKLYTKNLGMEVENGKLFLDGREIVASVRRLQDMEPVVYDREYYETADKEKVLYYMYRDLEPRFSPLGLRYDVTIIPPEKMGCELVKTAGHYHPLARNGKTYPEIYEVLEGDAHYLLQKKEEGRIVEVLLIKAEKGDRVIIPPNYGHVTINPSENVLVMANIVCRDFSSIYREYEEKHGAVYYELVGGRFVKNDNYEEDVELIIKNAPKIGIGRDIHAQCINKPSDFEFLKNP
ncbi:MAG: glucose-6-phosphate isomerase family protein [Candidatus Micrarchaeia archaeon]